MALVAFRYHATVAAGRFSTLLPRRSAALSAAVNGRLCRGSYRAAGGISDYRHAVGGELLVTLFLIVKGVRPVIKKANARACRFCVVTLSRAGDQFVFTTMVIQLVMVPSVQLALFIKSMMPDWQ